MGLQGGRVGHRRRVMALGVAAWRRSLPKQTSSSFSRGLPASAHAPSPASSAGWVRHPGRRRRGRNGYLPLGRLLLIEARGRSACTLRAGNAVRRRHPRPRRPRIAGAQAATVSQGHERRLWRCAPFGRRAAVERTVRRCPRRARRRGRAWGPGRVPVRIAIAHSALSWSAPAVGDDGSVAGNERCGARVELDDMDGLHRWQVSCGCVHTRAAPRPRRGPAVLAFGHRATARGARMAFFPAWLRSLLRSVR
jgi:hypothetical protein